jgi:hypothetical protein
MALLSIAGVCHRSLADGQMTSLIGVTSSLVLHLRMQRRIPAMMQINCVCDFGQRFSRRAGGLSP